MLRIYNNKGSRGKQQCFFESLAFTPMQVRKYTKCDFWKKLNCTFAGERCFLFFFLGHIIRSFAAFLSFFIWANGSDSFISCLMFNYTYKKTPKQNRKEPKISKTFKNAHNHFTTHTPIQQFIRVRQVHWGKQRILCAPPHFKNQLVDVVQNLLWGCLPAKDKLNQKDLKSLRHAGKPHLPPSLRASAELISDLL